jgi:opacity protein-like surface antigen
MKLAKLLCGVALGGLLASNAFAADLLYSQPVPQAMSYGGPYFGAKIGVNFNSNDPSFASGSAVDIDTINLDTGFTGSMVAGYAFGSRWGMLSPRLEVEAGYLNNEVGTYEDGVPPAPFVAGQGNLNAFYWFTNLLLDIPMNGWGFTPFIGGGVGFANVRLDNVGPVGDVDFNSEDTSFAWNLTAGLSYDISRNVTFDVAYRFVQFNSVNIISADAPAISSSNDIDNHQITAGVRVHL